MRTDGAGIGKRQADLKAESCGHLVEGKNLQRVVLFGDRNAGNICRIRWRGVVPSKLTFDAVDGQARQPQAEDPPPVYRKGTHHISIP